MVTETYLPEVNGVAITVGRMVEGMRQRQHHIHLIRPRQHRQDIAVLEEGYAETLVTGMSLPGYPELKAGMRLTILAYPQIARGHTTHGAAFGVEHLGSGEAREDLHTQGLRLLAQPLRHGAQTDDEIAFVLEALRHQRARCAPRTPFA